MHCDALEQAPFGKGRVDKETGTKLRQPKGGRISRQSCINLDLLIKSIRRLDALDDARCFASHM